MDTRTTTMSSSADGGEVPDEEDQTAPSDGPPPMAEESSSASDEDEEVNDTLDPAGQALWERVYRALWLGSLARRRERGLVRGAHSNGHDFAQYVGAGVGAARRREWVDPVAVRVCDEGSDERDARTMVFRGRRGWWRWVVALGTCGITVWFCANFALRERKDASKSPGPSRAPPAAVAAAHVTAAPSVVSREASESPKQRVDVEVQPRAAERAKPVHTAARTDALVPSVSAPRRQAPPPVNSAQRFVVSDVRQVEY